MNLSARARFYLGSLTAAGCEFRLREDLQWFGPWALLHPLTLDYQESDASVGYERNSLTWANQRLMYMPAS